MPDVPTAAIIYRSKDLAIRSAERCALRKHKRRQIEGDAAPCPKRPVQTWIVGSRPDQGMKSGLDFSKGEIEHSPHLG